MTPVRRRPKGITAWLVTWEHSGAHATPPRRVAAILNRRWSPDRVRETVELIYVMTQYSPAEQIAYAKDRSFNPYPAEFERVFGGPIWDGRIFCGHNPWLYARRVDNLIASSDVLGAEVTWSERPTPDWKAIFERDGIPLPAHIRATEEES